MKFTVAALRNQNLERNRKNGKFVVLYISQVVCVPFPDLSESISISHVCPTVYQKLSLRLPIRRIY
ncbi:hypothetical protein T03_1124 [Trichinella britovi]|uniref:Uncharacterized protein n=1 Tax=Trichinella britovi TaxID=45882 RepID=A0A0V1DHB5_TRIBR|nr:hypothetical protein T03_1124 [Trichinella britovi]